MVTLAFLTQLLLLGLGIFLMIVILLQRGRGGGLAGAFGGLGGQSAFGTKAGDVFTKITVVMAVAWVIVAGSSGWILRLGANERSEGLGDPAGVSAPDDEFGGMGTTDPFGEDAIPGQQNDSDTATPGDTGDDADASAPPSSDGTSTDSGTTPDNNDPSPDAPPSPNE